MSGDDFHDIVAAYQEKFGTTPMIFHLPPDLEVKAMTLMQEAIDENKPYETDADWYGALGIDPPPDDVPL